jgi:acetyltransferase-like isoleucine patch superfamily enzyme
LSTQPHSHNSRPNPWLSLFAWLLPTSSVKTWALRKLGNDISDDAIIGPNLVIGCGWFRVGEGTVIEPFNLFKGLARVNLGSRARIGRYNQISAAPEYQRFSDKVGAFVMHDISLLTNRHYIDCSGQVVIGYHAVIAGIRTIVQSHEFDLEQSVATVGRVMVGEYAQTGTRCLLLKNSVVPPYSVLAAGTVLAKQRDGAEMKPGLYGGTPAKFIRELQYGAWYHSDHFHIHPLKPFDDHMFEVDGR